MVRAVHELWPLSFQAVPHDGPGCYRCAVRPRPWGRRHRRLEIALLPPPPGPPQQGRRASQRRVPLAMVPAPPGGQPAAPPPPRRGPRCRLPPVWPVVMPSPRGAAYLPWDSASLAPPRRRRTCRTLRLGARFPRCRTTFLGAPWTRGKCCSISQPGGPSWSVEEVGWNTASERRHCSMPCTGHTHSRWAAHVSRSIFARFLKRTRLPQVPADGSPTCKLQCKQLFEITKIS